MVTRRVTIKGFALACKRFALNQALLKSKILKACKAALAVCAASTTAAHRKEKKRLIVTLRVTMVTLRVTIMREAHACLCKAQDQGRSPCMVSLWETIVSYAFKNLAG